MSSITSIGAPASPQVSTPSATDAANEVAALGLPPAGLALPSAVNTVNAELATAQWGVDPNLVGGVYGGSAASGSLFAGVDLLPLLSNLNTATAEQALALMGIQTPAVVSAGGSTSGDGQAAAASATAADAADASLNGALIDPLFGKSA
jgi:hypothetical protein